MSHFVGMIVKYTNDSWESFIQIRLNTHNSSIVYWNSPAKFTDIGIRRNGQWMERTTMCPRKIHPDLIWKILIDKISFGSFSQISIIFIAMILVKLWSKEFENFAFNLSLEDMRSKKQSLANHEPWKSMVIKNFLSKIFLSRHVSTFTRVSKLGGINLSKLIKVNYSRLLPSKILKSKFKQISTILRLPSTLSTT